MSAQDDFRFIKTVENWRAECAIDRQGREEGRAGAKMNISAPFVRRGGRSEFRNIALPSQMVT